MGVVGLLAETVEEEELGIILNATKVGINISTIITIIITIITIIIITIIITEEVGMILTKVAANISSSAIDMANSSKEYEEDLYRYKKQNYLNCKGLASIATNILELCQSLKLPPQGFHQHIYLISKNCRAFSFWIEGIAVTLISIFGIVGRHCSPFLLAFSQNIVVIFLQYYFQATLRASLSSAASRSTSNQALQTSSSASPSMTSVSS